MESAQVTFCVRYEVTNQDGQPKEVHAMLTLHEIMSLLEQPDLKRIITVEAETVEEARRVRDLLTKALNLK